MPGLIGCGTTFRLRVPRPSTARLSAKASPPPTIGRRTRNRTALASDGISPATGYGRSAKTERTKNGIAAATGKYNYTLVCGKLVTQAQKRGVPVQVHRKQVNRRKQDITRHPPRNSRHVHLLLRLLHRRHSQDLRFNGRRS